MIKMPVTYENLDGEEVTEEVLFHMTTAEIIALEASHEGGYSAYLNTIAKSKDGKVIVEAFTELLRAAYGVKTAKGGFSKKPEHWDEFTESGAYSALFMQLISDAGKSAEFVNGLIPKDLAKQLNSKVDMNNLAAHLDGPETPPEVERVLHRSKEELLAAFREKVSAQKPAVDYTGWTDQELMDLPDEQLAIALEQRAAKGL